MKRLPLALSLIALIVALASPAFAGKVMGVVNPMNSDLDANGHEILGVSEVTLSDGGALGAGVPGALTVYGPNDTQLILAHGGVGMFRILTGTADPAATGAEANPGSIYLRLVNEFGFFRGELWFKSGNTPDGWVKVAG